MVAMMEEKKEKISKNLMRKCYFINPTAAIALIATSLVY